MAKVLKLKIEVLPSGLKNSSKILPKRAGKDKSGIVARSRRESIKVKRLAAHGV